MFNNILIIGAHFDDTELAAAGSARRWFQEGKKVYKLTLTDNNTNFSQKNIVVDSVKSIKESYNACLVLGITHLDFDYERCNSLVYNVEVMQKVEKIIYEYNIDTVLIHSPNDANQDHIAAFHICSTAARHCPNILLFNINGYVTKNGFAPNLFIDISDVINIKKEALSCYGTEHDRNGRLFETCINRNKVWGYTILTEYAEAFEVFKLSYK